MALADSRPAPARPLKLNPILLAALLLSVVSLFVEQDRDLSRFELVFTQSIDFVILLLFVLEIGLAFLRSPGKRRFAREHLFDLLFLAGFAALFAYNKYLFFSRDALLYGNLPGKIIVLRNVFVLLKVFGRVRKLGAFLRGLTAHPARTVGLSFLLVVLTGTIVLMMPFTTSGGRSLGFLNSLFTATSAVCVTGLIVVDTATAFSFWGQLTVLVLIQIGGLGIMILSFFMAFVLRRSLSLEDKYLIAFMTSERDMRNLGRSVKAIIYITLAIEAAGAGLLYAGFWRPLGSGPRTIFAAVFHSISAFCNAGFSLFSDSLEGFVSAPLVNLVVCLLIVCGGLSFVVIMDLRRWGAGALGIRGAGANSGGLTLNSRVVLSVSAALLLLGTLAVYALEHRNTLAELSLGSQYLAAFFQSVTTRTAGFNTVSIAALRNPTYVVMMLLMFIGAASGSTAGGVKVNSLGLFLAYVRSLLQDRRDVTLFNHSVPMDVVMRALLILLFGLGCVFGGILVLSISEEAPFAHICFEAVSAFATVGLSAGITAGLSSVGKYVIIVLMFVGRVGPLTLLAAAAQRAKRPRLEYPSGEILIG